jgi:UTP--glucose-1-phosphate uridylyltransferase
MTKAIKKAVIPAAGFGTRFLPQTKAMPKEMLPVVDKPVIQYVVEEAVEAGIEDVIIVTGWNKRAIEDHFDHNAELERLLDFAGKHKRLKVVQEIAEMANFIYIRQKGPLGNATPIINARPIIQNEPFLMCWGDDFIRAEPSRARQLIAAYKRYQGQILGAIRAPHPEDTRRYGYAAGEEVEPGVIKVDHLIEKPGPERAPSELAIVSGFVFTPEMFEAIDKVGEPEAGEELVYIDALNVLLAEGKPVYAVEVKNGRYFDCGNPLKYLKTVVELALEHPEINGPFRDYLKKVLA